MIIYEFAILSVTKWLIMIQSGPLHLELHKYFCYTREKNIYIYIWLSDEQRTHVYSE